MKLRMPRKSIFLILDLVDSWGVWFSVEGMLHAVIITEIMRIWSWP